MTSKETGHCELALILPLEVINQYLKNDVIELFKKDIESIEKSLRFIRMCFSIHKSFLSNMHNCWQQTVKCFEFRYQRVY